MTIAGSSMTKADINLNIPRHGSVSMTLESKHDMDQIKLCTSKILCALDYCNELISSEVAEFSVNPSFINL